MTTNDRVQQSIRRLLPVAAVLVLLFGVGALALFAQEKAPTASSTSSQAPTSSATDASALLPLIPRASDKAPLPPGVTLRSAPLMPGEPPPDPDEFKILYGYQGRYYNVANLDGRVAVIENSLYVWPIGTWKTSGMVRNQTRSGIHIARLTARLLDSKGIVIATATASLPVADLRPGEPAPFMIEAPVASSEVKAVDWQIDSMPAPPQLRLLAVEPNDRWISLQNGLSYWLGGRLRNDATTTARNVQVVVAWLDAERRVRYVASPVFRPYLDRPETSSTVDLSAGAGEFFTYSPQEPWIFSLFGDSYEPALWGISK